MGAGSHSKQQLDLVALRPDGTSWKFDLDSTVRLPGAHGEEIVRSMFFDHPVNAIFTAGEDGEIKAWRIGSDDGSSEARPDGIEVQGLKKKKKRDSVGNAGGKGRFKPY